MPCDPPEMLPLHPLSTPVLVLGLVVGFGLWVAAILLDVGRE